MPSDKDIKKEFKLEASKNPDKYYATSVLKAEGFSRKQCACGTFFWSVNADQKTCGDPVCSGGFRFIGEKAKDASETGLDYVGVWKKFAAMFKDAGYTPIPRYPVVARWRDDTDFVQASIYDFQPYVVSGEVEPPANPLVVPQFCLRFNDIDNVGITGAHYTGFDMIGQHAFLPPEQWSQPRFFGDIHKWLKNGLGLPNEEITFHEDAWAGGGNFGPCMEYFSKGMELGNQVYMMYEVTAAGPRELKLKVLDMGMGHERNAWFAAGAQTSYESTFPTVMASLRARTGVKADPHFRRQFLPLASFLNLDETDDINKQWQMVADKLKMDITEVKEKALSDAALYSVAEHSRALLVALADGALPSNVGGGYNLRTILRRALDFIEQRSWDIDLADVAEQHARYLKPLYPELVENLENVKTILAVEKRKHQETRSRAGGLVRKALAAGISTDKMVELYDSHGIMPSEVVREARAQDLKLAVPDNFFSLVAERHEQAEQATATVKAEGLDLEGIPGTDALYLGDWQEVSSEGVVLKVIGTDVVLDKTAAYPTSGGQLHDVGMLEGPDSGTYEILDVFKQGACIVHRLSEA
ncbi:alanine--tRNA ligase, partial [Candidatus Woesearchaeota archaeon CG11_big_fil_rev_8_21_14_0_20_57_5]